MALRQRFRLMLGIFKILHAEGIFLAGLELDPAARGLVHPRIPRVLIQHPAFKGVPIVNDQGAIQPNADSVVALRRETIVLGEF